MLSVLGSIGSAIVGGVSDYFNTKQEIKKVEVEAKKDVIVAEAKAKIRRLEKEAEQDYNLDLEATKNMQNSWKDEVILVIFLTPLVLSFIPEYVDVVSKGFDALDKMPDWYMYLVVGMVVVIYGMRGLLKAVLSKKLEGK